MVDLKPLRTLYNWARWLGLAHWPALAPEPTMPPVDQARELLTVSEVAERCRVSRQTVYNWVQAGYLCPAVKYREGRGWAMLFEPAAIAGMGDRRRKTAS